MPGTPEQVSLLYRAHFPITGQGDLGKEEISVGHVPGV
jgi:hypothetical protein